MMVQMPNHTERHDSSIPVSRPVTCEDFQAQMPELIGEGVRDHEHLKTCARCSALLEELEYIASIAKELLPVYEPGDAVWKKIVNSIGEPSNESSGEPVHANGRVTKAPSDS